MTENNGVEDTQGRDEHQVAGGAAPGAGEAAHPTGVPGPGLPGEGAGISEDTGGIGGEDAVRPEEGQVRGRYVEGSYGKAGHERGRLASDEEGRFVEGDYGKAGAEGGRPEQLGNQAGESGRFVEADYGDAGTVPPRTAESEVGQYAEGDYGEAGTVDPKRKPGAATD